MRGRKPKPTRLRVIEGNRGKRPLNRKEPKAPRGIPPPFPHLSEKVKAAWMEIAVVLHDMRVLTLNHGHALEQMAENLVEIRQLRRGIKKSGRFQTVRTTNGSKKKIIHPAQLALSDGEKRFRAMIEQFGLTPSAASRVTVQPDEEPRDPAAEFFA